MNRCHVTIRPLARDLYVLAVTRAGALPFTLGLTRPTHAECWALASIVVACVHEIDARAPGAAGPDLLDMIHATQRTMHDAVQA